MTSACGVRVAGGTTHFRVSAPLAEAVWLCLFDGEHDTRHAMADELGEWWIALPEDLSETRYGFRAKGPYDPARNLWFDPAKLLVDPYAVELDRRFMQNPLLAEFGADTAHVVPRAIVPGDLPVVAAEPPRFTRGGLVYEIGVRGFTMLHPEVPERERGTVAALAHPAVIAHFQKLHVSAVELMPIVAWIDERHLPPLGLVNAWGYNPVAPMALDPGLCPGGVRELRETVAALHKAGIGVILDLVFNHTGESDEQGGTFGLRGLDPQAYATEADGRLVNVTGCGNTLDFAQRPVRWLALATLRHFVSHCGIDGFRFDLAPVLARGPDFDAHAPFFAEIAADPMLADRVMIAEPWDIGPGGYRLGQFPSDWLEWNDRFRDGVRRFWRGDATPGELAMRLSGSSDTFGSACRGVNFLAAHDGFPLADLVSYASRHNEANGENNRDGHGENFSWNCGVEGPSEDPQVLARRQAAQRAMLTTLFASTGTVMLTAGDECGRSQQGNNNAYCQDGPAFWLDWANRDVALEEFTAMLSATRESQRAALAQLPAQTQWTRLDGGAMTVADWQSSSTPGLVLTAGSAGCGYSFTADRNANGRPLAGFEPLT